MGSEIKLILRMMCLASYLFRQLSPSQFDLNFLQLERTYEAMMMIIELHLYFNFYHSTI